MPSPNRPRIGVKLVPNLLPSHVVDIPVAEHHAVVGVSCSLNYATNLCFEIHKAVNLARRHAFMYLFPNHVENGGVDFSGPSYAFYLFGGLDEAACRHKTAFVLEFHDAQVKGCGLCALRQGPVFSFLAHVVDFFQGVAEGMPYGCLGSVSLVFVFGIPLRDVL